MCDRHGLQAFVRRRVAARGAGRELKRARLGLVGAMTRAIPSRASHMRPHPA